MRRIQEERSICSAIDREMLIFRSKLMVAPLKHNFKVVAFTDYGVAGRATGTSTNYESPFADPKVYSRHYFFFIFSSRYPKGHKSVDMRVTMELGEELRQARIPLPVTEVADFGRCSLIIRLGSFRQMPLDSAMSRSEPTSR